MKKRLWLDTLVIASCQVMLVLAFCYVVWLAITLVSSGSATLLQTMASGYALAIAFLLACLALFGLAFRRREKERREGRLPYLIAIMGFCPLLFSICAWSIQPKKATGPDLGSSIRTELPDRRPGVSNASPQHVRPRSFTPLSNPEKESASGQLSKVSVKRLRLEGREFLHPESTLRVFRDVEVIDDRLFLVDGTGNIHAFVLDGANDVAQVDTDFGEGGTLSLDEGSAQSLCRADQGQLLVSNGKETFLVRDGEVGPPVAQGSILAIHPSGEWGLVRERQGIIKRVAISGDHVEIEPIELETKTTTEPEMEVFSRATVAIGNEYFVVGSVGKLTKANGDWDHVRFVSIFNFGGTELHRFGNLNSAFADDGFGTITDIVTCSDSILVLDGNMRAMTLWSGQGELLGRRKSHDLLGLSYPWMAAATVASNGDIYLAAANDRESDKQAEGIVFHLSL